MTSTAFERDKLVRFHHCDPAGIVFYPQYFVLFHDLLTDWFTVGLDMNYARLVTTERLGTPTVRIACEFVAPSTVGETLRCSLGVRELGRSSFSLALEASVANEVRVRLDQTLVLFSLDSRRSVVLPPSMRAAMLRFSLSG